MKQSLSSSSKKKQLTRFSYLLKQKQNQKKEEGQGQFKFFDFNLCGENSCQKEIVQQQIKKQQKNSFNQYSNRKQINFQLQSSNYQLFKQKIDKKSSFNSFHAFTPSKDQQKQYFNMNTVINQLQTIQNTKSNYVQTHRYNTQYENKSDHSPPDEYKKLHQKMLFILQKKQNSSNNNSKDFSQSNYNAELSNSQIKISSTQYILQKRHIRNLTSDFKIEQNHSKNKRELFSEKQKSQISDQPTIEKTIRFAKPYQTITIYPTSNSKDFKKHLEMEQKKTQTKSHKPKINFTQPLQKYCIARPTNMKTKQMSNKLRESSNLNYEHSIESIQKRKLLSGKNETNKICGMSRNINFINNVNNQTVDRMKADLNSLSKEKRPLSIKLKGKISVLKKG